MPGWNMPPGCSPSDIPGNRPEDFEYEALCDKIYDALKPVVKPDTPRADVVVRGIVEIVSDECRKAAIAAMDDERMAQEYSLSRPTKYRILRRETNLFHNRGIMEVEIDPTDESQYWFEIFRKEDNGFYYGTLESCYKTPEGTFVLDFQTAQVIAIPVHN